jgi:hypothetical protein
MAQNIDELYDSLKGDSKFQYYFNDKNAFETFLNTNPEADKEMKEEFNIDSVTSLLKKKDESVSTLPSPSVGQTEQIQESSVLQPQGVVEPAPMGEDVSNQNINGAADQGFNLNAEPLEPLGYGKSYEGGPKPKYPAPDWRMREGMPSDVSAQITGIRNVKEQNAIVGADKEYEKRIKVDALSPTTYVDPISGDLKEKASEFLQWGSDLQPAVGLLKQYDDQRKLMMKGGYGSKGMQESTEATAVALESKIISKLGNAETKTTFLNNLAKNIGDNFKSETELAGEGIYFKRERDNFLSVDPAYLSQKVNTYFDKTLDPKSSVYIPNTEEGNKYRSYLKNISTVYITGVFNQQLNDKIVKERLQPKVDDLIKKGVPIDQGGTFNENLALENLKNDKELLKIYSDGQTKIDSKVTGEITVFKNTIMRPIDEWSAPISKQIEQEGEQLKKDALSGQMTKEEYDVKFGELNNKISSFNNEAQKKIVDANMQLTKYVKVKKLERQREIESLQTNLKGETQKAFTDQYKLYQKEYDLENRKYSEKQLDANSMGRNSFIPMLTFALDVTDNLQASLANLVSTSLKFSGIEGQNIDFIDQIIGGVTKIAVGNEYKGRSLSGSKNFSEGLGAITSQVIDQVPTFGVAMAIGVLTKNPYLASAYAYYTDVAREVSDVRKSITERGGTFTEGEIAQKNVVEQHMLMAPLYLLEGSMLTGASAKMGSTLFMRNYVPALLKQYPIQLFQEGWQTYTGDLFAGRLRKADGTNKSMIEWGQSDGKNLAIDILPTVGIMGGFQSFAESRTARETLKSKEEISKFLGDKNLTQYVSEMYDVVGRNFASMIPSHLRISGMITEEEFKNMSKKWDSFIAFKDDVKNVQFNTMNHAKFYVQNKSEIERLKTISADIKDENIKKSFDAVIAEKEKETAKILAGENVPFVTFKYPNGSTFVLSENDAMKALEDPTNPIAKALGKEIVAGKDRVMNLTMETKNPTLNAKLDTMLNEASKREGVKDVVGAQTKAENFGGVKANNIQDTNNLLSTITDPDANINAQARVEEAQQGQALLNQEIPGLNIVLLDDKAYQELMSQKEIAGEKGGKGNFTYYYNKEKDRFEGEIHINVEKADARTVAHEISHAMLLKKFGEDALILDDFANKIKSSLTEGDNVVLSEFIKNYNPEQKTEEFLVELAAKLKQEGRNLSLGTIEKLAKVVSEFVSKLSKGNIELFQGINKRAEFIDYMNGLVNSLGQTRNTENLKQETTTQAPIDENAVPTSKAQDKTNVESTNVPLTPEQQEIKQEEINDFVENADETDPGIAVPVDSNQKFTSVTSKSQLGLYSDAILDGASFSNPLPTKTLKEIAEKYEGRLFIITSDGTGYGIDSEGNPIYGGFGFLTHPKNQEDGVGFASVDISTVKSTITAIRKFYGNKKVGVLVMVQPPATTINNSYGAHYFIRGMKQLAANAEQLLQAKNSFKQWVIDNKEVSGMLKKQDGKSGKRNTLSSLFNLIDSIDANTDVNEFTKLFLENTTFDSRKAILQGLIPEKADLNINKSTLVIKKLLLDVGVNMKNFLLEYGDTTFLTDDIIAQNVGGFVVGGFEIDIKAEEEMNKEIQDLQGKGFEHPLFNGKLPGTNHFALDGLYGVNENFAKFNIFQTVVDVEAVANKFKNENIIPAKRPNKNAIEGAVYADDKINQLVREKYKSEINYDEKALNKIKEKYPPNQPPNFETEVLPILRYADLKSAKRIEFKKSVAEPMGLLMNQVTNVATDVSKGIGFQPMEGAQEAMKTAEFVKFEVKKVASKPIKNNADFEQANSQFGIEDGAVAVTSKSQLAPKEVSSVSEKLKNTLPNNKLEELKKLINGEVKAPTETKKAYKLFKVKKGFPGELFPLFVGANESVTTGQWIQAKSGELTQTKEGKTMVKSTLGPLAYRPGWHSGELAVATHIGAKQNTTDKAPTLRADDQVWAEVEVGNDVNWQTIANERAQLGKDGKPIVRTAHITDQIPSGGSYSYKTNSNMTGTWVISGEIKVNKILTEQEVAQINKAGNAKDLPRNKPFDYEGFGFNQDGSVKNPQEVTSNQVARAYLNAVKTNINPKLVSAVDSALSGPTSKSQLNTADILNDYQAAFDNVINANGSQIEANKKGYEALIDKGYPYNKIKEQIGGTFDSSTYSKIIEEKALEAMKQFGETRLERQQDIQDQLQGMDMNELDTIRELLRESGFSDIEIFSAIVDAEWATTDQLKNAFGDNYRQTVKNALDNEGEYDTDFLVDLTDDQRSLKVAQSAQDLSNLFTESGLAFTDASIMVDYLTKMMEQGGLQEAATELRKGLVDMKDKDSQQALAEHFSRFAELSSIAGRLLAMARGLTQKSLPDMIAANLEKSGIVLTEKQKAVLAQYTEEFNKTNQEYQDRMKELEEDFGDAAFNAMWAAEKKLGYANVNLAQFLNDRMPTFWYDRITSGGSRALLNFTTVVLSLGANFETNILTTNPINKSLQMLRDKYGEGIKGSTLSFSNWRLARQLTKAKSKYIVAQNFINGNVQNVKQLEHLYDNMAHINFFKDANISWKFLSHFVKKITGKEAWQMTEEEFADAYNQTIIKLTDGKIELRDGKTYTIARSFAWTLSIGPQLTEASGRTMALGGDVSFGEMAAQRAMVDYLQNIQGTQYENGMFESLINKNGQLDDNAIRAISSIIMADNTLSAPFREEGLKRTLLSDNPVSKFFALARGYARKKATISYKKARFSENTSDKVKGYVAQTALGLADVAVWSLMPFLKVPANFVGVAMAKVIPYVAIPKYIFSEQKRNSLQKKFEKDWKGKVPSSAFKLKQYELDKINLFKAKRQVNHDFAQVFTSFSLYALAMSAAQSGALLLKGGDKEEEGVLKGSNLKGGTYNSTLHKEYLLQVAKNGLSYFPLVGKYFDNKKTDNFVTRRGGYAKEGDDILNSPNLGYLGFAYSVWGSIYQAGREKQQGLVNQLVDAPISTASILFQTIFGSAIESLPMAQGITRVSGLLKPQDPAIESNKGVDFWSGTTAAALSVFAPSIGSFISKGDGEIIQNASDINTRVEDGWAGTYGGIALRVAMKLNRNVSFATTGDYYKAMIGPMGEDLRGKNTYSEPGTMGAYLQAFVDPFSFRSYSTPSRERDKEVVKYIMTNQINASLTNMVLMYRELTGRDYEFTREGKGSNLFSLISNPMSNSFKIKTGNRVENDKLANVLNPSQVLDISLPNDMYRRELQIRGNIAQVELKKYTGDMKEKTPGSLQNKLAEIRNTMNKDDKAEAIKLIQDAFAEFGSSLDAANKKYEENFQKRKRDIIVELKRKNLLTPEMIEKLQKLGIANKQGEIIK